MTTSTVQPETSGPTSDDGRWRAVARRDAAANGTFIYAVKTTGVYCRPTCGARLPRRENVCYYDTPRDARRAGFRPCKRCRPDDHGGENLHARAVTRACRLIEQASATPELHALATAADMSPSHFRRIFKSQTGVTPRTYAAAHRSKRLRHALSRSRTITAAIHGAGFHSSGRFYEAADDILGMTPSAYRAGGEGATIRFAVGECSLGAILVAASPRGVCDIALGDESHDLVRHLQDRFPRAELVGGDRDFERIVARVVAFVEQPAVGLDLPLDIRGTAFQQRVWQKLREIPIGEMRTYAELAEALGEPRSARAVAGACAANRLAVAIPCHRVVRTDGSLSGYRWGVARKASLLDRERGRCG